MNRARIAELEASHRQLRAALITAGRRIRKLESNGNCLPELRQVLQRARIIAKRKPGDPILIRRAG